MARKNLLASVTGDTKPPAPNKKRTEYAMRGASRSMQLSIDDMAENARKMEEGETIVLLDPKIIDTSFVNDRMVIDDDDYRELKASIKSQGQTSPILVRPHPKKVGRYMVVFGHRRLKTAGDLGIDVRAVVKSMEDITHIIAQGQENTARADLSFIEKALFARRLSEMGHANNIIMSALTVDKTLLSRMLAVAQNIPISILDAIGPAKSVGRDRWEKLKKIIVVPANRERAAKYIQEVAFLNVDSVSRFNYLFKLLSEKGNTSRKKNIVKIALKSWSAPKEAVSAAIKSAPNSYSILLKKSDATAFGDFISENLDDLYLRFQKKNSRS